MEKEISMEELEGVTGGSSVFEVLNDVQAQQDAIKESLNAASASGSSKEDDVLARLERLKKQTRNQESNLGGLSEEAQHLLSQMNQASQGILDPLR